MDTATVQLIGNGSVYLVSESDATARDYLVFIKAQCELLPDRIEAGEERLWAEVINAIYVAACEGLDHAPDAA